MILHVNGEARDFPAQSSFTLSALIESLGMKSDRVAIELNREIAPRDRWPHIELKDGDHLEIVHFVGGGVSEVEGSRNPWHRRVAVAPSNRSMTRSPIAKSPTSTLLVTSGT